jgi:excisionase family DNA binding protein
MNLADAIRNSAGAWPPGSIVATPRQDIKARPPVVSETPPPAPVEVKAEEVPVEAAAPAEAQVVEAKEAGESKAPSAEPATAKAEKGVDPPQVTHGNVVRLELFLSGEQMAAMLRALLAGQHSVLTLREAATYLRLNPGALQDLADQGEIPGVFIDGKWRFPKASLDEWMNSCVGLRPSAGNEDAENVA